jgi:hypothetical protein
MSDWSKICSETLANSGLDKMDETLTGINTKSQELTTTLLGEDGEGGVVGAMMAEVTAAG